MTVHKPPPCECPNCGAKLDAATGITDRHPPSPGDVSVCLYCAKVLKYGWNLKLEVMPLRDYDDMEPRMRRTIEKLVKSIKLR